MPGVNVTTATHRSSSTSVNVHGETNSIAVGNISENSSERDVISLFSTLIGDIQSFQDKKDASGHTIEITFSSRDAAKKALCMNGFSLSNSTLSVTAINTTSPDIRPNLKPQIDDRRNLYVLGLPYAFTKNEFAATFSAYGTVSHCVILATVDSSSRRRGFVVMSTHEEAKQAMAALTRTQIKGNTLDVSWAVVQRSQGFLDGGDRAVLTDSRSSSMLCPTFADFPDSSDKHGDSDSTLLSPTIQPALCLFVTNLPAILFSQAQDLFPLFCPFGEIKKLDLLNTSAEGNVSVLVEYSCAEAANEAREALSGQVYGNACLEALLVHAVPVKSNSSMAQAPPAPTPLGRRDPNTSPPVGMPSKVTQAFPHSCHDNPSSHSFSNLLHYNFVSWPQPQPLRATQPSFESSSNARDRKASRYNTLRPPGWNSTPLPLSRSSSENYAPLNQMHNHQSNNYRNFSA